MGKILPGLPEISGSEEETADKSSFGPEVPFQGKLFAGREMYRIEPPGGIKKRKILPAVKKYRFRKDRSKPVLLKNQGEGAVSRFSAEEFPFAVNPADPAAEPFAAAEFRRRVRKCRSLYGNGLQFHICEQRKGAAPQPQYQGEI